jgi:large subunit ribosomal protein L2
MAVKKLTLSKRSFGGRNRGGHVVLKGRGGGNKQRVRTVDFTISFLDIPGQVLTLEKAPGRNSMVAKVFYGMGCINYLLLANTVNIGDKIVSSRTQVVKIKNGNSLSIGLIPLGTSIFNIEVSPFSGGRLVRAAGARGILFQRFENCSSVILPSNKIVYISNKSIATIGCVNNILFSKLTKHKAGFMRNLGFRPKVRGVAMNTSDHVHGGGHCISASFNKKVVKNRKTRSKFKERSFANFKLRLLNKK